MLVLLSTSDHASAPAQPRARPRTILFFLATASPPGTGLDDASKEAFPALIGQRLKDAGRPYQAVNAGLSGDTTAGGLRRIDWLLQRPVDILVLELGGNDGLRGLPHGGIRNEIYRPSSTRRARKTRRCA